MEILTTTIQARGIIADTPYTRPAEPDRPAYASIRILHTIRRPDQTGQWHDLRTEAAELKATGRTADLINTLTNDGTLATGTKIIATGTLATPDAYLTKDNTPASTPTIWIDRIGIDLLRQTAADQAKARRQNTTQPQQPQTQQPNQTWTADTYQAPTQGWPNQQA